MPRGVPQSSTVETPAALAAAMVAAIMGPGGTWLDPCTGTGAFIQALRDAGVNRRNIRAVDLSRRASENDLLANVERGVDFVEWANEHAGVCDRLIMNPPYVMLGRLRGSPRRNALEVLLPDGKHLHLTANYWCAFMLLAIEAVRAGGSMVAVLPASWDYARYAVAVRKALRDAFGDVTEIRSASPLFPEVLEGAVVVVAKNRGGLGKTWRRLEVPNAVVTIELLKTLGSRTASSFSSSVSLLPVARQQLVPLGDLMDIRIGAVTGDASYFLLNETERVQLGLPKSSLKPALTRARHLTDAFLERAHWKKLLDAGERVWLFRPRKGRKPPATQRYLAAGRRGLCDLNAYKVRHRKVWYEVPLPSRVDGFISGMGKGLPFLTLRQMHSLTATNTLYVVQFRRQVSGKQARASAALALITTAARRELRRHARVYADGLLKFEPAELARVCVPMWRSTRGASVALMSALNKLVAGDTVGACAIADSWFAAQTKNAEAQSRSLRRYRNASAP